MCVAPQLSSVAMTTTGEAAAPPGEGVARMSQEDFQVAVARALTAHETTLNLAKQQLELDLLLVDEGLKQEVVDALASAGPTAVKRVVAFKVVTGRLLADEIPGGRRLAGESDQHLADSILRFKPKQAKHDTPRDGKPWVWTLAPSFGATQNFREALADLAANGGNERLKVRRPQVFWGPAVRALAEGVLGKDVKGKGKGDKNDGKGKGKDGKGKGKKGKDKSKDKSRGKEKNEGKAKDAVPAAAFVPPTEPPPSTASTPTAEFGVSETAATENPSSGSGTQSYAALVAEDEASSLDAEMAHLKRESKDVPEAAAPLKKSNSPVVERRPTKAAGTRP